MQHKLEELERISTNIGVRSDYTQGGGGNTSVKLDNQNMAIKASGTLLSELTKNKGYTVVNYKALNSFLYSDITDTELAIKTNELVVPQKNLDSNHRPSIETGFHALLDDYVIHTHSVYANVLTCSIEGKRIAASLFPEALWVDYTCPGPKLTRQLFKHLQSESRMPTTIFLQNHGLIVSGSNADVVIEQHEAITEKIIVSLNLPTWGSHFKELDRSLIRNSLLFPDQVVFTNMNSNCINTLAGTQTLDAYHYIFHAINECGLTHKPLKDSDVNELENMESEKYRRSIAK